jgi:DNA (cytosine-5)-methyltransferase 1
MAVSQALKEIELAQADFAISELRTVAAAE